MPSLELSESQPEPRSRSAQTTVTVVIPCFNEEAVMEKLYERLTAAAEHWGTNYEVLLVDDGSRDRTWQFIEAFHQRDSRWKGIRLGRNFGHQLALRAGLQAAYGDVVAVLDADLQDPPELLGAMLDRWVEGYDVVVGVRRHRKEHGLKRLSYYLFYRVFAVLADLDIPLDAGDFCVMDRAVTNLVRQMGECRPFVRGLRSWVGFRQTLFPYERKAREAGKTKYSYWRLFGLAADGILSNSRMPLHFATIFGAFVSVVAFFGATLTLLIRLFPETARSWGVPYVAGTASVIISILFLGGVQLLCLGIMGAYIGRIYENVMRRPLWTVRETIGVHPVTASTIHRPEQVVAMDAPPGG